MNKIYLDNASTSFPKPSTVTEAVMDYMCNIGSNINRGCYENAYSVEELVLETRQLLSDLFNAKNCKNVVFTKNVTESLNVILKGFLKENDHVLVSAMEHNSVMRPLNQLQNNGVTFSRIPCNENGELVIDEISKLITPQTKAIVMTHASNVCGTIMPLKEVGAICKENNLKFIVDCAQSAGTLSIDMEEMNIDALAFTGHKGLLGPQGIGGFILKEEMINLITPLISGGSGSISHTEDIPEFMPDKFEAGTPNLPGIIGLRAGLLFLKDKGIENIRSHELTLTKAFIDGIKPLIASKHIRLIGLDTIENRIGVVSIQTLNKDISEVAFKLDDTYQIMTRVGMHCAPNAHKTLNTYPTGTLRFSFGYNNTLNDVNLAINALEEICHGN